MSSCRTSQLPWDDGAWAENDTDWARGCRLLQGWWRSQISGGSVGAGLSTPVGSRPPKLVVSMLPPEHARLNFLSDQAWKAFDSWASDGAGLVGGDRAQRNLMSSQPLAFNLFGPFIDEPGPLVPWLRTVDPDASDVEELRLEWAPPARETFGGGSAFDVFVAYSAGAERRMLGIECKYAENLSKTSIKSILRHRYTEGRRAGQRPPSYEHYQSYTEDSGLWKPQAAQHLDVAPLRQFWLNSLLAQRVAEVRGFEFGTSVVLACQHDLAAWSATRDVRAHLVDPAGLRWYSYEALLGTLRDQAWAPEFVRRYLDFSPISNQLAQDDPRALK